MNAARKDKFFNFRHFYMRQSPQAFMCQAVASAIPIRHVLCGVGPSLQAAHVRMPGTERFTRLTRDQYYELLAREYDRLTFKGD